MKIRTSKNEILYDFEECKVPDFWLFKLINAVFDDENKWKEIYIPGIMEAIDTLTDQEKYMILLKFRDGKTYQAIGDAFNLSRNRPRQIIANALRKLRHPMRARCMLGVRKIEFNKLEGINNDLIKENDNLKAIIHNNSLYEKVKSIIIEELNLSTRSYNCLVRKDIKTVSDIIDIYPEGLMKIRNLGKKSFNEITEKLKNFGIDLDKVKI